MNGTILGIGPLEVLAIAIMILLVFGPERVPSLMRDLGRNVRKMRQYYVAFSSELKREMEPFQEDIKGIQDAAQGLREDLAAIREAADIRGIITASDLEPPKPAAEQTIAPPAVAEAAAVVPVNTPAPQAVAPVGPVPQPYIPHNGNGAGIELSDDSPWVLAVRAPRADRLDDDNPWAA